MEHLAATSPNPEGQKKEEEVKLLQQRCKDLEIEVEESRRKVQRVAEMYLRLAREELHQKRRISQLETENADLVAENEELRFQEQLQVMDDDMFDLSGDPEPDNCHLGQRSTAMENIFQTVERKERKPFFHLFQRKKEKQQREAEVEREAEVTPAGQKKKTRRWTKWFHCFKWTK